MTRPIVLWQIGRLPLVMARYRRVRRTRQGAANELIYSLWSGTEDADPLLALAVAAP